MESDGLNGRESRLSATANTQTAVDMSLLARVPEWEEWAPVIREYLTERSTRSVIGDEQFGVVFATSDYCNLVCRHCAVAARYRSDYLSPDEAGLSTDQVRMIIDKVRDYASSRNIDAFFMFGGGEPLLRTDIEELLSYAASTFGTERVGFCTNGTFASVEDTLRLAEHVGLLEVSLDGFEEYHNKWRLTGSKGAAYNPYRRTMELIEAAASACPHKLEVASMVTTENLETLPDFAQMLSERGVTNYSVHRPMPIGRMGAMSAVIPDEMLYLKFFALMVSAARQSSSLHFHVHHSLESIYSALLLGKDIHHSDLPMGSSRHSIGIDWHGNIHFDPWAMVPPFSALSPGNLVTEDQSLNELCNRRGSVLSLISEAKKANVRCRQCSENCTGGMRLVAIAESLRNTSTKAGLSPSALMSAVSAVDPACPLPGINAQSQRSRIGGGPWSSKT